MSRLRCLVYLNATEHAPGPASICGFVGVLLDRAAAAITCAAAARAFVPRRSFEGEEKMEQPTWHGTTILAVRKGGKVAIAGDGQVSLGQTIIKGNARKVRRLGDGSVIAGFAGATADAFALFERLESKLEQHRGQLARACVEMAKDWRTDRYLRRLEAMMAVADAKVSLVLTGNGDVLEPEDGLIGIGSGGSYALSAARALMPIDGFDAETIARRSLAIAADICVYTNRQVTLEMLDAA
jgi:ATP-dependent HslUV protease subunit HslV